MPPVAPGTPPAAGSGRRDAAALRRRQAIVAGHTGDTGALRDLLGDTFPQVRASALRGLVRLGHLEPLTSALGDPAREVRLTAVECVVDATTAGTIPDPGLAAAVVALLGDPDPLVAEAAAWACGEIRPPGAVGALEAMARSHPDPLCRESAVAALGALGEGLDTVLAALDDKPAVRRRAVVALAAFDDPRVERAWERARHDRDRQVREAVEELCGPADPPAPGTEPAT